MGLTTRRFVFATLASVALPVRLGHADDKIDDANRSLIDMEERVRVLTAELREAPPPDINAPDRRVIEAEGYYSLGNYVGAATILLDVLEKWPGSRAADDALVLLGESLYQSKDYNSARTYFQQAIKRNTGSRKEQSALQRLVELTLRTNEYDGVEEYLTRLEKIPSSQLEPSVPYVRGKYLFLRDRVDEAILAFQSIPTDSPLHLQAQYFLATCYVKKGDLAAATSGFDAVLKIQPKDEAETDIQDLARLAIARLFYERNQPDKARDIYASIGRNSKYFGDAMYESAWNSIKAKDFKSAYRALDLMILQNPTSPEAPELRLLMGNLNLRINNYFQANDVFSGTRDEFEPIHRQLKAALQRSQAEPHYFESLIGKGLERFDIALFVPPVAVKWLKSDADLTRMMNLAAEVGELQRGIRETEQTIGRLERVVNGEGKVSIFPDLLSARTKSDEVLTQALEIRRRFLDRARGLAAPHLSAEENVALDEMGFNRARLEQQIDSRAPATSTGGSREDIAASQIAEMQTRLAEAFVSIQSMEAELVAVEQYYSNSKTEQKIRPEELKRPVAELRASIAALRGAHERIKEEVVEATRLSVSFTGDGERAATTRLATVMGSELAVFQKARTRMSPEVRGEFDALAGVITRASALQSQMQNFEGRVEAAAEKRLGSIKERLAAEKIQIQAANGRFNTMLGESQAIGGGLAQAVLSKVTDRFYDLVVQSDVGLIDVSWGLKDQKTSNLTQLITQQKQELKAIEDDFRSLLQEDK